MAQNTDLTHKQPKVGFLTDSYKNLKITFVKDGHGQEPRNSKCAFQASDELTDTGENVKKWTRVFSTRCLIILVARTRRKKRRK